MRTAYYTPWHDRSSRAYIKMNPNGLWRFCSPSDALKLTTGSKPQTIPQHALKIHPPSHWVTSSSFEFHLTAGNDSACMPGSIILGWCCSRASWEEWIVKNASTIRQCHLEHAFSLIACLEICELLDGSRNITVRLQQKSRAVCWEGDTMSFMWQEEIRGYVVQQLVFLSPMQIAVQLFLLWKEMKALSKDSV